MHIDETNNTNETTTKNEPATPPEATKQLEKQPEMRKQLLDGARATIFYMDPDDIVITGLDKHEGGKKEHVLDDPHRVEHKKDDEKFLAMVNSVMAVGVREPVLVTVVKEGDTNVALVVDGRQRVLAAREAKRRLKAAGKTGASAVVTVPVLPEKNMEEKFALLLMVHLNEQRKNDEPLVKAEKAYRLIQQGASIEEVAIAFRKKPATIQAWLTVHKSMPKVKKAVKDGLITMTHAERIAAGSSAEEQDKLLAETLAEIDKTGKAAPISHIKAKKASLKGRKTAKNNGGSPVPKRRTLRRLVENDAAKKKFGDEFIRGIRFAIGDLAPAAIGGLTGFLSDAAVRRTGPA
jgi:ParB-like chromosome segregation protein Spo0J